MFSTASYREQLLTSNLESFCLLRLANLVPNFALDNGVVVSLGDVCYYKVVTLEPVSLLTVHVPAVASGVGVGVGGAVELDGVSLLDQPGLAGAGQRDAGGVPHLQQEGHRPPRPVRDV